jgi:hypothetical protein
MSHDEFTKLFNYMELKFGAIDKRFDTVEGGIRDIKFELAELSARAEDHHNEFLVLNHQVGGLGTKIDQQGRWIHKIADHTGATLSPA